MTKRMENQPMPFPGEVTAEAIAAFKLHKHVYDTIATSFQERACKREPKLGQIPELDPGKKGTGCEYKTYPPSSSDGSDGKLNIPDLYKKANEQNVHIKTEGARKGHPREGGVGLGTGVIVGKRGNEILVMTDDHVVANHPGNKRTSLQARFGDGHVYNGEVVVHDQKNDTAIVAFKTGADTDKEYHPATIQDQWSSLKVGQNYLTTGFPEGTSLLHASPGKMVAMEGEPDSARSSSAENRNRFLAVLEAHTREGNSGGATYNSLGQVVGTLEGGQPGDTRISLVNPISKQYVATLLKRAGADPSP